MHFRDIEYFIEVARRQSLTAAAEHLNMSQPSLSMAIKRLEDAVGATLFHRSKMGVHLTVSGKTFLDQARLMLQQWEHLKSSVYAAKNEVSGLLHIGCHASVAHYHFPSRFFELLKENPKLNIRFHHSLSREINDALVKMHLDIGIVVNPNPHPDLVIKPLHEDDVGFWHNLPETAFENRSLRLLCDPDLKQTQDLLSKIMQKGFKIEQIIESSNFEVLARLAKEQVGVGILPRSVAQSSAHQELQNWQSSLYYQDTICLVYRGENRFVKAVSAIADCFKSSAKAPI